jgi:hypothetical protein
MLVQHQIPWLPLPRNEEILGHISVYYSNKRANLPVRDVTKPWDQKSDPNIETMTYGLFSTCMPPGRRNIVKHGNSYLFFMTSWKEGRIITGYYELESYIDTGIKARNKSFEWKFPDYALKAKRTHFVKDGIKLAKLEGHKSFSKLGNTVDDNTISGFGPRGYVHLDQETTLAIRDALDAQADITREYIAEIHRLEKQNEEKTGYRYPTWRMKEGFSEKLFKEFLKSV